MKIESFRLLLLGFIIFISGCSKNTYYKIPKNDHFEAVENIGIRLINIEIKEIDNPTPKLKAVLEVHNYDKDQTGIKIKDIFLYEISGSKYIGVTNLDSEIKLQPDKGQKLELSFSVPQSALSSFYLISITLNGTNFFYPKENPSRMFGEKNYENEVHTLLTKIGADSAHIYSQSDIKKELDQLNADLGKQNPNSKNRCEEYGQLKLRLQRLTPFMPREHQERALKATDQFQTMLIKGKCIEAWAHEEADCFSACNFMACSRVANLATSSGDLKTGVFYFNKSERCYLDKTNLENHDFDRFATIAFPLLETKEKYKKLTNEPECNSPDECKLAARLHSDDPVEFSKDSTVMKLLTKACLAPENKSDYAPCFLSGSFYRSVDSQHAITLFNKTYKIRNELCEKNDIESCYQLGLIFEQGSYLGHPMDLKKSQKYFQKACNNDHTLACQQLR